MSSGWHQNGCQVSYFKIIVKLLLLLKSYDVSRWNVEEQELLKDQLKKTLRKAEMEDSEYEKFPFKFEN